MMDALAKATAVMAANVVPFGTALFAGGFTKEITKETSNSMGVLKNDALLPRPANTPTKTGALLEADGKVLVEIGGARIPVGDLSAETLRGLRNGLQALRRPTGDGLLDALKPGTEPADKIERLFAAVDKASADRAAKLHEAHDEIRAQRDQRLTVLQDALGPLVTGKVPVDILSAGALLSLTSVINNLR
jgi:hypothetical protein